MSDFSGSYNEGLSLVYMAARLDGGFAAVSRAFHEVKFPQLPTRNFTISSLFHKVIWGKILGTLHVHFFREVVFIL